MVDHESTPFLQICRTDVLAQAFIQPQPCPSPVQDQNGKSPSARSSMGPAARPSAAVAQDFSLASPHPGGGLLAGARPASSLAAPPFKPQKWFENFRHYEVTLIRVFITILQQVAWADPMTALLSPAVRYSMLSQMEAKLANTANTVGNPNDAAATLAQQRAKLKAAGNAAPCISAPAPASSGERGT
ncbi:hypothetical protein H4582DRAFT_2156734 [Lactarius indigo]|nr:hypothetical protein H4582DRAFT_2156734 [Lactarius indigo]